MRSRNFTTFAFGLACFFLCSAQDCNNHLVDDNGFDLWCGDELCTWTLERGDIARVPTWHEDDPGVALIGPEVSLSQLSPEQDYGISCVQFDVVADIEPGTRVVLEVDFFDDGEPEVERVLPASSWEPLQYVETYDEPFKRVRFRLRKETPGRAAFAQLEAIECAAPVSP